VNGFLKASQTLAQNSASTFGGIGLSVNAAGAAPGYTTATRSTGASAVQTGYASHTSTSRNYNIHAANNTGLNATVMFSYLDNELGALPSALLNAYRSQDGGATWKEFAAIARNSNNKTVTVSSVPGFSIWVLGSYSAPLPVTLTTFTGHAETKGAKLSWNTASEVNTAGFDLQRSIDGHTYDKIAWVPAKGASNYAYLDATYTGRAYYRLRMVDITGQEAYSQVVYLTQERLQGSARLSPMPALGNLTLSWPGAENQTIHARIVSVEGKDLFATEGQLSDLSIRLTTYCETLPAGSYQLHLDYAGGYQVIRVVK
jgi:hypothetical protein